MVLQHSRYYYTRLSEKEKAAYRSIYETWIKADDRVWIKGNFTMDIQCVMHALFLDNPELFFVDNGQISFVKSVLGWEIQGNFYWKGRELESKKQEMERAARSFLQGLQSITDKEAKFQNLQRQLTAQVTYNQAHMGEKQNYTIYGALCRKTAVCEGIAKAYKYLCDQAGLRSLVIAGNAVNGRGLEEGHGWNIIHTDTAKAHVDVTWDMAYTERGIREMYFGMSDEEIGMDHSWNRSLVPACQGLRSRFRKVCSSREMERVILEAVQKQERELCLSFNRKFHSQEQILHMVEKYIKTNFPLWRGRIQVTYIEQANRAIICLRQ